MPRSLRSNILWVGMAGGFVGGWGSVRRKPAPWLVVELSDGRAAALAVGGAAFVGGACVSGVGEQSCLRGWRVVGG